MNLNRMARLTSVRTKTSILRRGRWPRTIKMALTSKGRATIMSLLGRTFQLLSLRLAQIWVKIRNTRPIAQMNNPRTIKCPLK